MAIRYPTNYNSTADLPADLEDMAASIQEELDQKVDKVTGKGLSTNDYTTNEKNKLAGIEAQANKTVVDSSLSSSSTNPVQNKKVKEALDTKENTSNKVTSISSSSTNTQYPSAKLLYDKLAEKQEQIDALVEENSTLKKQQLKGQASGSSIQLTDSAEDLEIENVVIKGAMSQVQYEGKNKLTYPYTQSTTTSNGVTFTARADGSVLVNGTATGYASFKLYGDYQEANNKDFPGQYLSGGTSTVKLKAYNNTNNSYTELGTDSGNGVQINTTVYTKGYIELGVNQGTTVDNEIIYPMVLNSLSDRTYEPFCGGEASPNLNYPQEIHCVTGTNNVTTQNKNLFDKNNANILNAWIDSNGFGLGNNLKDKTLYIACEANQTYTVSRQIITSSFRVASYDDEIPESTSAQVIYPCSVVKKNNGGISITITTGANAKYLLIHYGHSSNDNNILESLATIQIEKGSTATAYEMPIAPFEINLGNIKLYDGDKIQISFINKAGYKKVTGASIVKTMQTSILWRIGGTQMFEDSTVFLSNSRDARQTSDKIVLCSHLSTVRDVYGQEKIGIEARTGTGEIGVRVPNEIASTLAEFNSWIINNNVKFAYALAEPITTPITDPTLLSQLETLINLKTHKQITNIEATGSDLSPVLEFQYSKDLQTVIDNMQAQILS